jgi:hypothetical protein
MTLSVPSALAALIRAAMPPPLAAEVTLAQSVPLLLELPEELLPQPAARMTVPSAAATAAILPLFPTISPPHMPPLIGLRLEHRRGRRCPGGVWNITISRLNQQR